MRLQLPRVLAVVVTTLLIGLAAVPADAAEVQRDLVRKLERAAPDQLFNVFVRLHAQLDSSGTMQAVSDMTLRERRAHVIAELKRLARETQAPILAELDALRGSGAVGEIKSLWIANMLIAELNAATIRGLTADSAVSHIHEVRPYKPGEATDEMPVDPAHLPAAGQAVEPNITLLGAPLLWDRGYMGQGKVIANSDTGTCTTHPDIANHIWTNIDEDPSNGVDDDGNGFVDDWIGWDFEQNDNNPTVGCTSHGTNTAGIIVGDGTNGRQTGVAPGGDIMILKACGESAAMQAVQYALDNGADALTSSCSYKYPSRPFYQTWRDIGANTLAAGMPQSNSIGNQGGSGSHPIPYNISAPGVVPAPWLHPSQTTLGGLGNLTATGGILVNLGHYSPSGHGPSAWEDIQANHPAQRPIAPIYWDYLYETGPQPQQGLLKPDVVMPTNVTTTNGSGYSGFGGTSAATPHSGGSLGLLLSTAPNATPAELSQAMQSNVIDIGDPGKDNEYGSGLPQLADAAADIMPIVTPTAAPYGQAVDVGVRPIFQFKWINNTNSQQTIWRRVDLRCGGSTQTLAGPGDLAVPAGGGVSIGWDFLPAASLSGQLCEVDLVVDDALGGNEIARTTVDLYVR